MATLATGKTWVSGDEVTPAGLNNMVNNATISGIVNADIASAADIDGSKLLAASVRDTQLATGAVTETKIAAAAITGQTTIDAIADADTFLVHDASSSALRKVAYSGIKPTTLTFGTAQNSTSGTSLTFTGIPSTAKRITVIFNGVSTTGASGDHILVRVGTSSGIATSGYISSFGNTSNAGQSTAGSTAGFGVWHSNAADTTYGHVVLTLLSGTTWVASGAGGYTASTSNFMWTSGGSVSLSGSLDRVVVTSVNGTDTFDAGSVNICYE